MSVISLTYSTCLVHNVSDLRTSDTKAIECEFCSFSNIYFLHSQEHSMQGMMV